MRVESASVKFTGVNNAEITPASAMVLTAY